MSRPTKLTQEVRAALIKALRAGMTRTEAAACAGVSYDSLKRWHDANPDFADALRRADAEAVMEAVEAIQHASWRQWRAAAWWLERRYPQEWGKQRLTADDIGTATRAHGSGLPKPTMQLLELDPTENR